MLKTLVVFIAVGIIGLSGKKSHAEPTIDIPPKERCPVCGMFVVKYQPWISQLHFSSGDVAMFDGVKDMMAYYFEPETYGGKKAEKVLEIHVKDYYSQKWLDGKTAIYVTGSDVYGPMGHELIPFGSKEAAENFFKDHHGKEIHMFDDITLELIDMMRSGMTMQGHK